MTCQSPWNGDFTKEGIRWPKLDPFLMTTRKMQWSDKMGEWHFGYGGGSSTPKHSYNFNAITGIEVIGNIHDNPELVGGGE